MRKTAPPYKEFRCAKVISHKTINSYIFIGYIWEPPDIPESDGQTQGGEEELNVIAPLLTAGGVPASSAVSGHWDHGLFGLAHIS